MRRLSRVSESILRDFDRAPVKARREYSDGAGRVLKRSIGHYDGRSLNPLVSRGFVDLFVRCECGFPCDCECNGWHITAAGRAYLAEARS